MTAKIHGANRLTRNSPQICGLSATYEQIQSPQHEISTANSGNSLLMVQSVLGGCKLDPKFSVQSNRSTSQDSPVFKQCVQPPRCVQPPARVNLKVLFGCNPAACRDRSEVFLRVQLPRGTCFRRGTYVILPAVKFCSIRPVLCGCVLKRE